MTAPDILREYYDAPATLPNRPAELHLDQLEGSWVLEDAAMVQLWDARVLRNIWVVIVEKNRSSMRLLGDK